MKPNRLAARQPADTPPAELAPFRIELSGNRRAVADGFAAVLSCSDTCICVRSGRFTVRFMGRNLHVSALTEHEAVIEGFRGDYKISCCGQEMELALRKGQLDGVRTYML